MPKLFGRLTLLSEWSLGGVGFLPLTCLGLDVRKSSLTRLYDEESGSRVLWKRRLFIAFLLALVLD